MPKKKLNIPDIKQYKLLPLVERKSVELIRLCKEAGMPIRITEGYRSLERQAQLYAQGRTAPGKIVTNAKPGESIHQYGCAFDVVFTQTGYEGDWNKLGQIGKMLGFTWGGDFKSIKDRPHFELTLGYKMIDFKNKKVDYSRYT